MCGIIGIVSASSLDIKLSEINKLIGLIKHRGPDSENYYFKENIFIAHTRLSIVDLSKEATQPMWNNERNTLISFNGEIYNYKKIKLELEGLGVHFKTKSDTEVILEGYSKWGVKIVEKLDGMFAFTIYDFTTKRLILARDRFGKKPLYYKIEGDKFLFGSEADIVNQIGLTSELSIEALNCYFSIGYIIEPQTLYKGVYKLQSANYLELELPTFKLKIVNYWNPLSSFQNKTPTNFADACENTSLLFEAAIKKRLMGDVPVGVLLSGGIDSSAIVSYLFKYQKVETFSAVFENKIFSEKSYIDQIVKLYNTTHHECKIEVNSETLVNAIMKTDQLLADNSIVAMHQLCNFSSKHIKVVMSGDGGDEIFGGYVTYIGGLWNDILKHIPAPLNDISRHILKFYLKKIKSKVDAGYQASKFFSNKKLNSADAHYYWRQHFDVAERIKLLGECYRELIIETDPIHIFRKYYDDCRDMHMVDAMQYVDIMTWLRNDILVKTDTCAMRYGLEVRCPYLDLELFNYVAALPPSYRLNLFRKKILLKEILKNDLPYNIINRRKAGFNVPVRDVFQLRKQNEYQEFNLFGWKKKYPKRWSA